MSRLGFSVKQKKNGRKYPVCGMEASGVCSRLNTRANAIISAPNTVRGSL